MLTRITPALAVAYWVSTHSARFGLHTPTRSPLRRPAASIPPASRSTASPNCAYVYRTPWVRSTSASASGTRAIVRSRL